MQQERVSPGPRRGGLPRWWWLIAALLCGGLALAADPYQALVLRNNTHTRGIMLRANDREYVIATGRGVQVFRRAEVTVPPGFTTETDKINTIMLLVEDHIRGGAYDRIAQYQEPLRSFIATFEQQAQTPLNASDTDPAHKDALRAAIQYYQQEAARVQPTVEVLNLARTVREQFHNRLKLDVLPFDLATMQRLIELQQQYNAIVADTPLAARERAEAADQLGQVSTTVAHRLRAKAMADWREKGDPKTAIALMTALRQGDGALPLYHEQQQQLSEEMLGSVTETIGRLTAAVTAALVLDANGVGMAVNRAPADALRETLAKSALPALESLAGLTFGKPKAKLDELFATSLAQYRQQMQQEEARLALLEATLTTYIRAEAAYAGRQYGEAAKLYQQVTANLETALVPTANVRQRVADQDLRSQANQLLADLRAAATLGVPDLAVLITRANEFVTAHATRLEELAFSVRDLRGEIGAVTLYHTYLVWYDQLVSELEKDPLMTWKRVVYIRTWLKEKDAELPDYVRQHWQGFLTRQEEAVFNRARDQFLQRSAGVLSNEENQRDFLTFVQRDMENRDYDRALNAIGRAVAAVDPQEGKAFIETLLTRQLAITAELVAAGQLAQAAELYRALIEQHPGFASRNNVRNLYAEAQVKIADALVTSDRLPDAIALYETICKDNKLYAQKHGLLERVIELNVQQLKLASDQGAAPELLAVYERYSKLFAGGMGDLTNVRRIKKELIQQYRDQWEKGQPVLAVRRYAELVDLYPNLVKDMQLDREVLSATRNHLARLVRLVEQDRGGAGGVTTVPTASLEATKQLLQRSEMRTLGPRNLTEGLYLELLLHRAQEFFAVGQIAKAFEVYDQILRDYPEAAAEKQVAATKESQKWDLRMERIRRPLGIRGAMDWLALVAWLVLWGGLFWLARHRGRLLGDLQYRLHHFANAAGVFLLFLIVFLLFDLRHSHAFVLALVLPGVLFHGVGATTYYFFPLIYHERRLWLAQGLLWLAEDSPVAAVVGAVLPRPRLRQSVGRLEEQVRLMNDRRGFEIHLALRLADSAPAKGYAALQRLLQHLDHESQRDARWRQHQSQVVLRLGQLAQQLGHQADARRHYDAFIEHHPKDADVRQAAANLAYEAGDYEAAIPHYKVALAVNSHDEQLWYKLGRCFFATEKYVASYKCFEAAKNKDREILFYGARAFSRAGEREQATKWYQALLKQYKEDSEAVYYLACTFAEMGDDVKALKVASLIKAGDGQYAASLTLQGHILFKKNDTAKALACYQQALGLQPKLVPALVGQGQVLLAMNKLAEAHPLFTQAVALEPKHAAANYYLGVLLHRQGQAAPALEHLKQAARAPDFQRWAARRVAALAYFAGDTATAIEYAEQATTVGENSPWFLYLFAHALATRGELRRCEQILIKILGRSGVASQEWTQESATRAMYTIGISLFQQHAYKMAHQCFEFVRENPITGIPAESVAAYIEEARFRMVVNWLQKGEYMEAQARCAELQLEAQEKRRYQSCQYYLSLCQLFQAQYEEAAAILGALVKSEPQNPRYRYHLIVAELGMGNEANARAAMNAFAVMNDRPDHLSAGLVTIQAYMNAAKGKVQEAERSLARVSLPDGDAPGARYLREKIVLARIFYLCHLHDYDTIRTLMQQLSAEQQAKATYLQAVSCLQSADYQRAREFLKPFADSSPRDRQLYTFVSGQIALLHLQQGEPAAAQQALQEIPKPPKEIVNVLTAWSVASQLGTAEDVEGLNSLIEQLKGRQGQMEDEYLNYFMLHNLAVLYLKRAYAIEDGRDETPKTAAWTEAVQFWFRHLFANADYWNLAQARFVEDAKTVTPFTAQEVESLNQAAKDQYFVNIFIGYVLWYLAAGDEQGVDRHLTLLRQVAEQEDKLKVYFRRLGEKVEKYLRAIDKSNELWNSWEFTIASLDLQVRVAEVLGLDHASAKEQLELYRQTRARYSSPSEYQKAKRQFNTVLLEAIQLGVRGNFTEAGEMIDKVLSTMPPGVDLAKVMDSLRLLREACKNPAAYAERGVNLSVQFEKAYAIVRTINVPKGKADANAKKS